MFVRFNVRVECESLVKICEDSEVCDLLAIGTRVDNPRKAMWEVHAGSWTNLCQAGFRDSLRNLANSRVTHETLCLDDFNCAFLISLPTLNKPHYPWNCKETFREKTLAIHLRVRDCKPTIIYTISLSFPLLLPLQLQILERFLAETFTSPNLSVNRSFGVSEKYWKKPLIGRCNLELSAGSGKLVKTRLGEVRWELELGGFKYIR